ncbi:MAG: hypothetical protein OXF02_00835 [Simkaniaceae bacterium]|nr:hypothetical protein [Simkaniaceae bacterium]
MVCAIVTGRFDMAVLLADHKRVSWDNTGKGNILQRKGSSSTGSAGFFPDRTLFSVLDCLAETRVHRRKVRLPQVGRLRKNVWIITAMSLFGLPCHPLTGETLAVAIKEEREKEIPEALRLCR